MANLLKVSEAASLGLHTMALLAAEPAVQLSAKDAATAQGVSEAHLAKVLQRLARAGLVNGIRGPKGGFMLARPAEQITLREIYEAIDGPIEVRRCLFSTKICSGDDCIFGGLIHQVDEKVRKYLSETKLSQVTSIVQGARTFHGHP